MKISDEVLNKLFPITAIIAGLAWLAAIVLAGYLYQSFLFSVVMVLACAAFVFGFIKFLDMNSYDQKYSPLRYLYWFCMVASLLLAAFLLFSHPSWWMWLILCAVQVLPFYIVLQMKANEDRILDVLVEDKLSRERQAQMAAWSTNIYDFADALGLKVIGRSSASEKNKSRGEMNISQFAGALPCQHCSQPQRAKEWPIKGDYVAFYYQKEHGKYSLKLTCPHCGKDWYVVWDDNPGTISPLSF